MEAEGIDAHSRTGPIYLATTGGFFRSGPDASPFTPANEGITDGEDNPVNVSVIAVGPGVPQNLVVATTPPVPTGRPRHDQ